MIWCLEAYKMADTCVNLSDIPLYNLWEFLFMNKLHQCNKCVEDVDWLLFYSMTDIK